MKARILTYLFLLFTTFAFSQENGFLEFNASLDYGYRFFITDSNGSIFQPDRNEIPKLGYRAGLAYNVKFRENIWLKAGTRFWLGGFKSKDQPTRVSGLSSSYKKDYAYLEIPLSIRLEKPVKAWKSFWEFGLCPSFYTGTVLTEKEGEIRTVTGSYESKDSVNPFALGGFISHGILYQIHEIIQIYGALAVRTNFSPTHNLPNSKEYLFNAGFEMGVQLAL